MALLYDVVPDILMQTGKVKNPCEWRQRRRGLVGGSSAAAVVGRCSAEQASGCVMLSKRSTDLSPTRHGCAQHNPLRPMKQSSPSRPHRSRCAGPNVDAHSGVLLQYYGITEE